MSAPPRGHPYGHLRWVSQWPPPMGPQWPYKKTLTKENMNKCGPSMATSSGHPMVYRLATSTRDLLHMFIHEIYVVVPFTKIVLISFVGMLLSRFDFCRVFHSGCPLGCRPPPVGTPWPPPVGTPWPPPLGTFLIFSFMKCSLFFLLRSFVLIAFMGLFFS